MGEHQCTKGKELRAGTLMRTLGTKGTTALRSTAEAEAEAEEVAIICAP